MNNLLWINRLFTVGLILAALLIISVLSLGGNQAYKKCVKYERKHTYMSYTGSVTNNPLKQVTQNVCKEWEIIKR